MSCCGAPAAGVSPSGGGGVDGGGTAPRLAVWIGPTTLGDGTLQDDGAGTLSTPDAAAPVGVTLQGGSVTAGSAAGAGWSLRGGDGGPAGGDGGTLELLPGDAPSGLVGAIAALGQVAWGSFGGVATAVANDAQAGPVKLQDYSPAGWRAACVLRISPSGAGPVTIGGIDASGNTGRGKIALLLNVGTSQSIVLNNQDAGSSAQNRIVVFKATATIPPGSGALLWYDITVQRWRALCFVGVT